MNRRNPALASRSACRGKDGVDGVIVNNHIDNSKTNRCGVKMISWFGEGSFVWIGLDPFRDKKRRNGATYRFRYKDREGRFPTTSHLLCQGNLEMS